jgi:hypothetical protein
LALELKSLIPAPFSSEWGLIESDFLPMGHGLAIELSSVCNGIDCVVSLARSELAQQLAIPSSAIVELEKSEQA